MGFVGIMSGITFWSGIAFGWVAERHDPGAADAVNPDSMMGSDPECVHWGKTPT